VDYGHIRVVERLQLPEPENLEDEMNFQKKKREDLIEQYMDEERMLKKKKPKKKMSSSKEEEEEEEEEKELNEEEIKRKEEGVIDDMGDFYVPDQSHGSDHFMIMATLQIHFSPLPPTQQPPLLFQQQQQQQQPSSHWGTSPFIDPQPQFLSPHSMYRPTIPRPPQGKKRKKKKKR